LAEPGGICVSRAVRDQVRDKLDFSLQDMEGPTGQEHRAADPRPPYPARRRAQQLGIDVACNVTSAERLAEIADGLRAVGLREM
jgi:hypothetical protein